MAVFFLSENVAAGDGQEADPCTAGLMSLPSAERTIPAIPIIFMAVNRTANSTHLRIGVLISIVSVVLLFEENMKVPAVGHMEMWANMLQEACRRQQTKVISTSRLLYSERVVQPPACSSTSRNMSSVFPEYSACYLVPTGKRPPYSRQMYSCCPSP